MLKFCRFERIDVFKTTEKKEFVDCNSESFKQNKI